MMLVKQFRFKRNNDKGGFQWTAHSELERPGFYRGFTAVGKTLADVKEFAALVRLCADWLPGATFGDAPTRIREANADDMGRQLVSAQEKIAMRDRKSV